ncbi:hypothetical protein AZI86_13830 [Bdellovibrio bacteriovorus]|uniref:Uncharacterized protein n=1 Tax=Bdellovibrio bacteriovorus TaxID=959 RepID=A0A150WJJ9_BDEBC|nr:hypothetical protein [Bdellovibrio bacteriovorus]KYG63892.1 hypothetical protein AZI86_13830 [Bdellovibrio bacteriovorus]
MSLAQEFKKYKKLERVLTALVILISVLAPISFSWIMDKKLHGGISSVIAFLFLAAAFGVYVIRHQVSQRLMKHYESLDIGAVLQKKMASEKQNQRFVIINTGREHFHLQCLCSGTPLLVSKSRVREDFDIEN